MADWGDSASPIQADKWGGMASPIAQTVTPAPSDATGLSARIGQDYQNRVNEGQQAADSYVAGNQGKIMTGLDFAGKIGAGTAMDAIGETAKSAYSYAPQGVKDAVSAGVSAVANSPAGDAARYVGNKYEGFAQRHPDAARHVEAATNIGSLLAPEIPVKGSTLANSAVDAATGGIDAAKNAVDVTKNAVASGLEKVPALDSALGTASKPTIEQLKASAQKNYAKVAASGESLSPEFTNSIIDHAQNFGFKDPMASAIAGKSPMAEVGASLEPFRNKPMTLESAAAVDQALTDRLEDPAFTDKKGVLNTYGRQLLEVKNNLRQGLLSAADNGHLHGGEGGIPAYFAAVKDWAAQSQLSEIQRIVDRASYMDNPATALKTGFRTIAVNPGRLSQFPKDVQGAIKNAARDGDIANILRTNLGSRLISTMTGAAGGAIAGPPGSLVGAAIGAASSGLARNAAESMQMGRVNKVTDAIVAKSSLGDTPKTPLSKMIRAGKVPAQTNPLSALAKGRK